MFLFCVFLVVCMYCVVCVCFMFCSVLFCLFLSLVCDVLWSVCMALYACFCLVWVGDYVLCYGVDGV